MPNGWDEDGLELKDVWLALKSGWWLVVSGVVVCAAIALALSLLQTPKYTSHTQLFVSAANAGTTTDVLQGSYFTQDRVASYAEILKGGELSRRVIDRLDLDLTPGELSAEITAAPVTDTVLLDVTVTDPSRERAEEAARAIGVEFPRLVEELEVSDGNGASPVQLSISEPPTTSSAPTSPNTTRNVVLGVMVGLVLGCAAALLRRRLDRTVRSSRDIEELTGAPVVGTVLRDDALAKNHIAARDGRSRPAENFRQLRTNLQFLSVDEPPRVLMVTSPMPSEGKTTLVINLALALADAGKRVVVVEADLRRPKVTRYLELVSGAGLTNVLAGTAPLEEVLQEYGGLFSVLGSGPTPPNPGELLSSSHMEELIDKLRATSDYVIVDAPPMLPVADSSGMARYMDGVLLIVRYGKTTKDQVRQAGITLERVGAKLLGLVLNVVPAGADAAGAYGYGYDSEPQAAVRKHRSA